MSEYEIKRDKNKGFKASDETIKKINDIINKSGKDQAEFFEDLVNELAIKDIVSEENGIPLDLRKHFESDIQKLKNATNSIISIFTSQMENISVEKNQWQAILDKQLEDKQSQIDKKKEEYEELSLSHNELTKELDELKKEKGNLEKERNTLLQRTDDQTLLIGDRNEKIEELNERINRLNEMVISKEEELKSYIPLKENKEKLQKENDNLLQQIDSLKAHHIEELQKKEDSLLFQCEKEKHRLERRLTEQFSKEKENLRNEVRRETEASIKEFYVGEIQRKEEENRKEIQRKEEEYHKEIQFLESDFLSREIEYKQTIDELQDELEQLRKKIEKKE